MPNITKSYVDGLKCQDVPYIKWDSKLTGFGVRVYPRDTRINGKKSFVLRYTGEDGKRHLTVVGNYGSMTPGEARERAEKIAVEIRDGADPLAEKKAKRQAILSETSTFEKVVEKFIELRAQPRQRTWKETKRTLTVNCADWLNRPIASIKQAEAQDLIDGYLIDGQPAKARVTYVWLKAMFEWARKRGIVTRSIMDNVDIEIEPKTRDRVYSDEEIDEVWKAANGLESVEGGFIKLLLLLGVRKSELAGMRREEFDDPDNPTVWTIPHERVKIKKSVQEERVYIVPLPPLSQRIIKSLPKSHDELLFPGRSSKGTIAPGTALKKKVQIGSGVKDWTYHSNRHTVATWLKKVGHSEYERGLVLNHVEHGVTAKYSHSYPSDLKLKLLKKWSDHIADVVQPKGVAVFA